jgi:hypothetical protein
VVQTFWAQTPLKCECNLGNCDLAGCTILPQWCICQFACSQGGSENTHLAIRRLSQEEINPSRLRHILRWLRNSVFFQDIFPKRNVRPREDYSPVFFACFGQLKQGKWFNLAEDLKVGIGSSAMSS